MNFVVAAQLPPALARWPRDQGHSAQHLAELDLLAAEDDRVWVHALANDALILTKDEDFAERSARASNAP